MKSAALVEADHGSAMLKQDDHCPKCKDGYMEHRQHRFSTERGPNLPDCDWLECSECGFQTDPE